MSKTMAEVIHAHHCLERIHNEGCMFWQEDHESAAALSAAGFGLVADAKAEALEEAAANIITNDPLDYWNGHLPEGLGFQEAMSRWLKAHAKAKRAAS